MARRGPVEMLGGLWEQYARRMPPAKEGPLPELPEVEVIRRDLVPKVVGRAIESAKLTEPRLTRRRGAPQDVAAALAGRTVTALRRRGKCLLFELSGAQTLVVRLGMTGQLRWAEGGDSFVPDSHTHAQLVFGPPPAVASMPAGGSVSTAPGAPGVLFYRDVRKFGELVLLSTAEVERALRLGPEPLDPAFGPEDLFRLCRAEVRIKTRLLDQARLAGVGNIYADEALFRARIRPTRRARSITRDEAARLVRALRAVLEAGIRHRGSSFSDYRDAAGRPGRFVRLHRVYQRQGRPCPRCGTPIRRITLGQRGTHFCPACQR
jgi:formamidopyrimidine-DNA glycosylase